MWKKRWKKNSVFPGINTSWRWGEGRTARLAVVQQHLISRAISGCAGAHTKRTGFGSVRSFCRYGRQFGRRPGPEHSPLGRARQSNALDFAIGFDRSGWPRSRGIDFALHAVSRDWVDVPYEVVVEGWRAGRLQIHSLPQQQCRAPSGRRPRRWKFCSASLTRAPFQFEFTHRHDVPFVSSTFLMMRREVAPKISRRCGFRSGVVETRATGSLQS